MATQSIAVPRFNPKNIPAMARLALVNEANEIRSRMRADLDLTKPGAWTSHPEFDRLSAISRVLEGKRAFSANDLLIAGFVLADYTYEATELGVRGPMKTDNAFALLEGEFGGQTVRFEVPAQISFTFGEPKLLKGRFEKFN